MKELHNAFLPLSAALLSFTLFPKQFIKKKKKYKRARQQILSTKPRACDIGEILLFYFNAFALCTGLHLLHSCSAICDELIRNICMNY